MTKKLDTTFIQIVHPVCCGLDVHKKNISVCLITVDKQGKEQSKIHHLKKDMDILVVGRDIFFKNFRKRPGHYCCLMKTLLIGHF